MHMMKLPFVCLLAALSSGCVGSTLLYGPDETPRGDYPDLHSVPDKPNFATPQKAQELEQDLEAGYEDSLALNERLRREAKASAIPAF
jgi:hypothetical protein